MSGYSNFTSSGEAAYGSAGEQPYKEYPVRTSIQNANQELKYIYDKK